jgi:hypothetical protein
MVLWENIGWAGGLFPADRHVSLSEYGFRSKSKSFPTKRSVVFGNTSSGDVLVHSDNGQAGILSHETGRGYTLGAIGDTLEWVFAELLAGRKPEIDIRLLE